LSLIGKARFYCAEIIERIRLIERYTNIKSKDNKKVKPQSFKLGQMDGKTKDGSPFPDINKYQIGAGDESGLHKFSQAHSPSFDTIKPKNDDIIFQSRVYYNPYMQELAEESEKRAKVSNTLILIYLIFIVQIYQNLDR
jgi:hypothetical protein